MNLVKTWCENTTEGKTYLEYNGYAPICRISSSLLSCLGTTVADSGLSGTKVTIYHAKCSEPDFKYGTGNATQLVMMSLGELRKMIRDGKVTDGFTMTALGKGEKEKT